MDGKIDLIQLLPLVVISANNCSSGPVFCQGQRPNSLHMEAVSVAQVPPLQMLHCSPIPFLLIAPAKQSTEK